VKSIFQKDKDKEKEKEKDSERMPATSFPDAHYESGQLRPEIPNSESPRTEPAPHGPIVNHALLAAQSKHGARSWVTISPSFFPQTFANYVCEKAATPSPPPGFGSTTNLPILKPRAKSTLAPTTSTSDVQSLKAKFEGLN
jgi:hypothetical protein